MKQIARVILILFILIASVIGFIHSPWGKNLALKLLTRALNQSGLTIKVDAIEGALPQKMSLRNLNIQGQTWELKANSLSIDLSILPLFKKEISVNELKGDGISWNATHRLESTRTSETKQSLPFAVEVRHFHLTNVEISNTQQAMLEGSLKVGRRGKVGLNLHAAADLTIAPLDLQLSLEGPLSGPLHGELNLKAQNILLSGAFTLSSFKNVHLDGHIFGIPHVAPIGLKIDVSTTETNDLKIGALYQTTHWAVKSFPIEKINGEIKAIQKGKTWSGASSIQAEIYHQNWTGKTEFSWELGNSLSLNHLDLQGPSTSGQGAFTVSMNGLIDGQVSLSINRMQALSIPDLPLFGAVQSTVIWRSMEGSQLQNIEAQGKQVFFGPFFAENLVLSSQMEDPFGPEAQGSVRIDLSQGNWKQIDLKSAHFEASLTEANRVFQIGAVGEWKHPLEVTIEGSWMSDKNGWAVEFSKGNGIFYNHPWFLESSTSIRKSDDLFLISPISMRLGDGTLNLFLSNQNGEIDGKIAIRHLPIDMLSLNPLDLSIGGTFDLVGEAKGKEKNLEANLIAKIENLELIAMEEALPFRTSGEFSAEFKRERLEVKGSLSENQNQLLKLDLNFPVEWDMKTMKVHLLKHKEAQGNFSYHGNIEDLLDFFDLGTHRFEGEADCQFTLSQTIDRPSLKGYCNWTNGAYQNYYTGTQLQNIEAKWEGEGDSLILRSFQAQDYQDKGSLAAQGKISLVYSELFPFDFQLSLERLNCVEIDLVSAEATGEVEVVGNLNEAWTKGDVYISQSSIVIPDHIPRPIPKLQVVYRNPIHPIIPTKQPSRHTYPLHLDLRVTAPEGIFIGGRGLDSEWKGDFAIGGTITSPSAKGKLELIKGEFVFASRHFKLSEGALSLSGKEHEMPSLNIAATVEEKGVSIIARLKGPLNKPQLTFQSAPPLPMSSILAILLFGEDLAEINGVQALQLANAIANIAGEGPDILENTRKSIGVDRLRVITVPSGAEEGDNAIALQVGKYVAQGVIISISQGAEDNSSNISIEVELKYGFSFQAETQQQQEQGKFTIKWNLNY